MWPSLDAAEQDVVDGDVDELDEEADEAHDQEPHARGIGYPGKLYTKFRVGQWMCGEEVRERRGERGVREDDDGKASGGLTFSVRLGALLDQVRGVLGKFLQRLDDVGVHVGHGGEGC